MDALLDTYHAAGFVGPVLAVCMVMMWYALGVRAWTLRRPRVGDLDGLLKHARQGRTLVDAAVRAMVAERGRRGAVQRGHLDAVVAPYKAAFEQYGTLVRSAVAGKMPSPVVVSTTLAARYWKLAPSKGWPGVQPATG